MNKLKIKINLRVGLHIVNAVSEAVTKRKKWHKIHVLSILLKSQIKVNNVMMQENNFFDVNLNCIVTKQTVQHLHVNANILMI